MSALKVFSEITFYKISMDISHIIDYVEELFIKQLLVLNFEFFSCLDVFR